MPLNLTCKSCGKPVPAIRRLRAANDLTVLELSCPSCQATQSYTLDDVLEAISAARALFQTGSPQC